MKFKSVLPSRLPLRPLALAAMVVLSSSAQAVTFGVLDASGNVSGLYTPVLNDWVLAPTGLASQINSVAGGGFAIDMGLGNWGSGENAVQPRQISGAGLLLPASTYGYVVNFSANLRTWDSYNDGSVPVREGAADGLWDLFSVNMNTRDFYWNLVAESGATTPPTENPLPTLALVSSTLAADGAPLLNDPLLPTVPAGSVVTYANDGSQAGMLPGATWAWGGRDYAAGFFESVRTSSSVRLAANAPIYVSLVLDSRTTDDSDTDFPSWGQFSTTDVFSEVPGGANGQAPGVQADNPLLPVDGSSEDGSFVFAPYGVGVDGVGTETFLFVDPDVAVGFEFTVTGGPKFTQVLLPTLGDASGFDIEVLDGGVWTVVGHVAEGGTFSFANAVAGFRVTGIEAALNLDPNNPVVFVAGLKFDAVGTASITMQAITVAVPEPASYALMLGGLAALLARRRRAAA